MKNRGGNVLSNEDQILERWREHLEALLSSDFVSDSTVKVQIREESSISEAKVARPIKDLESGKAEGVGEI
jgi:hypothetical protein